MENHKLHNKILRCIEIIERANQAIDFHIDTEEDERDFVALAQYTEIKSRATKELEMLLNQLFLLDKIPLKVAI